MTDKPHYRDGTAAGFKGHSPQARENGKEAAASVSNDLSRRHRQMIAAWGPYGALGATPEQVGEDLQLPVYLVRPRAGELVKRGLLYEVGKRPGMFGCNVMAYSTVKPADRAEAA